jgi:hypothetical protein
VNGCQGIGRDEWLVLGLEYEMSLKERDIEGVVPDESSVQRWDFGK